jgi:hypothetical protein
MKPGRTAWIVPAFKREKDLLPLRQAQRSGHIQVKVFVQHNRVLDTSNNLKLKNVA